MPTKLQPLSVPSSILSVEDSLTAREISDWLLKGSREQLDLGKLWDEFCRRLALAGVPVERGTAILMALHAIKEGVHCEWRMGQGSEVEPWHYAPGNAQIYQESPLRLVHEKGSWLHRRIDRDSATEFPILQDLLALGYTDYVCIPIIFANGMQNAVTFASREPEGFSQRDLALLREVMPTAKIVLELMTIYRSMDDVLAMYVGREPGGRILAGEVRRGTVNRMQAAILIADMRNFTLLSDRLGDLQTVELLDAYYDCIIPPILERGGEVLKFTGDGVLAIFQDGSGSGTCQMCRGNALEAALEGQACLDALDTTRWGEDVEVRAGIALHHGEVAFGNVGSGERLDFTVIGKDVNLAARLGAKCRTLGEPVLMSKSFAEQLCSGSTYLGDFPLRGLPGTHDIYVPERSADGTCRV
ncbi:adenylate/guanylate cyclase domain-containing protein [Nisaea acidiphila]|uniref:Adenylate/guanylate cyclase domain-containing protein n=1 Tax=Nisaea acidiphila TaxID=1862145 RepID=A0A9J7APS4_9PROT|nr:adenylate/guanylate cyclase domain-containing protein [Nisaea acidiphila]UUX48356.1 adenylate/guanylate cyclase domain-containing protein [Nisaea acidiphila]